MTDEEREEERRELCRQNYQRQVGDYYKPESNMVNEHETPERPLPWKADTPEDAQRVIEQAGAAATMHINNLIESKKIENELAGIRKELHTLNELLKRRART